MACMRPENLLAFEQTWPSHTPEKDRRIRKDLGVTPARYYVLLHRAAHTREGIEAHPITARYVRERTRRAA